MTKLIATADLHQHPRKWKLLVQAVYRRIARLSMNLDVGARKGTEE